MRRKLLFLILFVIFLGLFNDHLHSSDFKMGLKGLVGATGMSLIEEGYYDVQLGYGIGASVAYYLHESFLTEINLLILQKGARTIQGNTISINYFSVPLMVKADPFGIGTYILAGFQFNLLLNGTLVDRFGHSIRITDSIEKTSFDAVFGFAFQKDILVLEIRYEYGLTDILKNRSSFGNVIEKNNTVYFMMGVMFDL